jgi:hypothetical protein
VNSMGQTLMRESSAAAAIKDVSIDDFMTGLIAGLAALDVPVVSIRDNQFYKAVVDAFKSFETEAAQAGVRPRFWLRLNRIYGDSPPVRDALTRAVQRDLVSLDNPEYQDMRLKLGRGDADLYLDKLAGGSDLYIKLAQNFLRSYSSYAS